MRHAFAVFAVLLATLLVPLGIGSTWLALRVDDTQAYVDTVAPLADNADLRARLADEVAGAAVATLQSKVPVGLPASLEATVRTSTETIVESDGFPEFWRKANADTHREFLAVVHDEKGHVDTSGWVVVDLRPLLDQVLEDVLASIPGGDRITLPSTPLPLPVIRESDLEKGRTLYQLLDGLSFWVPLLWAVLVLLAVVAVPGWRGRLRTLAAAMVGLVIGGALVIAAIGPLKSLVVDHVEPEKRDLARLVIDVVLDTLRNEALTLVVVGLLVAVLLMAVSLLPRRSRTSYA